MTPFTTTRLLSALGACFLVLAPATAQAADCRPFLAGPTPAEQPALSNFALTMVVMSRTGKASYARGAATWRGPLTVGSIPRPALWRTFANGPAAMLDDLEPILLTRQLPSLISQFQSGVDIQVFVGIKARVSLKFMATGEVVQFDGICSTGGVIHGTTVTRDYLIFLKRPPVVSG